MFIGDQQTLAIVTGVLLELVPQACHPNCSEACIGAQVQGTTLRTVIDRAFGFEDDGPAVALGE
jgi:hypothetical protein